MEQIARASKKFLFSYRTLPHKKQYLEFFTALLSIPVLLTVIILNISTLRANKSSDANPAPTQTEKIIVVPNSNGKQTTVSNSGSQVPCKPRIEPFDISSPQEGDVMSDNPVSIEVSYPNTSYCAIVWSYRINGGSWSSFDDKSVALYNLPVGNIRVDLRVKSIISGEVQTMTRNFTYNGTSVSITPSQNNQSSSSAH